MARKKKVQQLELSLFDDASFFDEPSTDGDIGDIATGASLGPGGNGQCSADADIAAAEKEDADTVIAEEAKADVVPTEEAKADAVLADGAKAEVVPNEAEAADADIVPAEPKKVDADNSATGGEIRLRAKRRRLRVTFADGTVLCHASATATMIEAIDKIGVERVASLGMESCHVPLVSTSVAPRYAQWTKPIKEGWYLMAQSDTDQKYMQLKSIVAQLALDVRIELGDFETMEADKTGQTGHRKKSKLCVSFPDGFAVSSCDNQKVVVATIEHIGFDKVKKTGLQFAGKHIVTPVKSYNCQTQMPTGEWLTVPPQAKDKYKMLRVISSITHTPFDVRIE